MNLKQIIKDVQEWLMMEGRCEGCGRLLSEAKVVDNQGKEEFIVCECSREYGYNSNLKVYERFLAEGLGKEENLNVQASI